MGDTPRDGFEFPGCQEASSRQSLAKGLPSHFCWPVRRPFELFQMSLLPASVQAEKRNFGSSLFYQPILSQILCLSHLLYLENLSFNANVLYVLRTSS